MIANFFVKIFPYIFVISFVYLEFSPVYFYENELVKPFISFLIIYSWICHDTNRFRPVWLLAFGLFYDFLKDGIVGITPLFFIILYHLQKKSNSLVSFDFKETWIKFIIYLLMYFVIIYLCNYFFENHSYNFKKNILCLVLTIVLFPLFFSLIEKLTMRFGKYDN